MLVLRSYSKETKIETKINEYLLYKSLVHHTSQYLLVNCSKASLSLQKMNYSATQFWQKTYNDNVYNWRWGEKKR